MPPALGLIGVGLDEHVVGLGVEDRCAGGPGGAFDPEDADGLSHG